MTHSHVIIIPTSDSEFLSKAVYIPNTWSEDGTHLMISWQIFYIVQLSFRQNIMCDCIKVKVETYPFGETIFSVVRSETPRATEKETKSRGENWKGN